MNPRGPEMSIPENEQSSEGGGRKIIAPQKVFQQTEDLKSYQDGFSKSILVSNDKMKIVFEHILENIDIQIIQAIIGDFLLRSGVSSEVWNILKNKDFFALPYDNQQIYAMYFPVSNNIQINIIHFEKKENILFIEILKGVIHEIVHSMSHNRVVVNKKTRRGKYVKTEVVSGYHLEKKKKTSFEAFNEGVTERIAHEVTVEYLKRTGNVGAYANSLTQNIKEQTDALSRYSIYVFFVYVMCERISEYSGIDKDDVWQSVVRGYFTVDSLYQKEIKDLFEHSLGDDFVNRLKIISNETEMDDIGRFAATFEFPDIEEFSQKWLAHLGLTPKVTDVSDIEKSE